MTASASPNYPPNSNNAKKTEPTAPKENKKVEKVVTGKVVSRKKPLGSRVVETFFSGDDVKTVAGYVLFDVIIPSAKSMFLDSANQALDRIVNGEDSVSSRRISSSRTGNYTPYNRVKSSKSEKKENSYRARANHDFEEFILETRTEALEVLERLGDLIQDYNVATVSDLYDILGKTGSFTDDKWGWTDIRGADIRRTNAGYLLDLPRPKPID